MSAPAHCPLRRAAARRRAAPRRVPDPEGAGPRQAARLPRQRQHEPEAARRHRGDEPLLRRDQREHPPGDLPPLREGDRRLRGRTREGPRLPERGRDEGDRLHARDDGGDQPRRLRVRSGARVGPGDEMLVTGLEHHSNIVPWQLLCERTGASLRVLPIDDSRRLEARGAGPPPRAADAHRRDLARLERARHDQPREDGHRRRSRAGDPGPRGRRPGGPPHEGRRAGARLRLLRLLEPQDVRPDRHRRALREGGVARRSCRPTRVAAT